MLIHYSMLFKSSNFSLWFSTPFLIILKIRAFISYYILQALFMIPSLDIAGWRFHDQYRFSLSRRTLFDYHLWIYLFQSFWSTYNRSFIFFNSLIIFLISFIGWSVRNNLRYFSIFSFLIDHLHISFNNLTIYIYWLLG